MAWSLKNLLEEVGAQLNWMDGGKTAATVRAARNQAPPPATISRSNVRVAAPQQQPQVFVQSQPVQRPRVTVTTPQSFQYNGGANMAKPQQSLGDRIRDIFDANSQADQYRRYKFNQEAVRVGGATAQQKPIIQENPGNLLTNTVGAIPRMANTFASQAVETGYTAQQHFATQEYGAASQQLIQAMKSGDPNQIGTAKFRMANASKRLVDINNRIAATKQTYQTNKGGLFNAGTLYNEQDSYNGDLATGARKIGLGTAEAMLDAASFGVTGASGKVIAKEVGEQGLRQGLKAGLRSQVPNIVQNALINTGQGAASAGRQGASTGDILKAAAISGVVGTAADVGLAVGGGVAVPKIVQFGKGVADMPEDGFIRVPRGKEGFLPDDKPYIVPPTNSTDVTKLTNKDLGYFAKQGYTSITDRYGNTRKIQPVSAGANELDSLNPTGGLYVDYDPASRATMPLGKNMTTLDKTMSRRPDELITVYRGAPSSQKSIVPGDFITTNKELAASYTGDGKVLSKKVPLSHVLDDSTEPLGEEYIYRPPTGGPRITSSLDLQKQPTYEAFRNTPEYAYLLDQGFDDLEIQKLYTDAQKATASVSRPVTRQENQTQRAIEAGDTQTRQQAENRLQDQGFNPDAPSQYHHMTAQEVLKKLEDPLLNDRGAIGEDITALAAQKAKPAAKAGQASLDDIKISTKPAKQPVKDRLSELVDNVQSAAIDRYHEIDKLVETSGKNLKPSENPSYLIKRYMGGMGIASQKIDTTLKPIIQQTDDFDSLRQFLVAERMTELSTRGIGKSGKNAVAELTKEVGADKVAQFQKIANELYDYQRNQLEDLVNVGALSKEQFEAITTSNQKYVPFNRVMDDLEQAGFIPKTGDVNVRSNNIKRIKGSDREIVDPIESIIKNTYDIQKTVEKQRTLNALVKVGEFDRIDPKTVPVGKVVADAKGKIKQVGKKTATEGGDDPVTVFGKSPFEPKDPHITVLENGKPVYYKTDKALADAIKGIDEEQLNLAVRMMSLPAKVLRAGATSMNVGFAIPNVLRDQFSAAINNKYGGVPIYDYVSGFSSLVKKDDYFKRWMLSGADQASFFAQDRTMLRRSVSDVTGGDFARAGKLVKNPLELLRAFGEFSENSSRVGVYKRALKGAAKEGYEGMDLDLVAMKQARESTIDFARRGSKMKAYNAITPFLNARIQGSLKLLQSAKTRPVQTGVLGMAYAGVPAAILYAHNSQYPQYDEIPDYIKDNHFIIMTGNKDTPFIKIPKGEVGSIFGNPVEKFLSSMKQDDPDAFKDTLANIAKQFMPVDSAMSAVPTAFSVPMQIATNYDTFRGQNIVSPYKKDLPAALQFDKNTSETAKAIGDKLNISPAKLEFGLRGVAAGVGKQALQLSDMALNKLGLANGKSLPVQDFPVIDRFLGQEKDLSASAQKIYEQTEKMKQDRALENYRIKQALESGDTSVLDGLSPQRRSALERSVRDAQIEEQLSPQQRALFNATQEQRDALRAEADDSMLSDLDYVEGLKSSASSGSSSLSDYEEQAFRESKNTTMEKDGRIYYKAKNGDIKSKTTFDYQYDNLYSQVAYELDGFKASGDINSWMKVAEQKRQLLEAKVKNYDKATEADDYYSALKAYKNHLALMQKYAGYGGFKKPRSGRSGRRSRGGRFDYKLFGFADPTKSSASLRQVLKKARLTV